MFWESVIAGLKVLTYWETYVAGIEYLAIFFIPMIFAWMVSDKVKRGEMAIGCLSMILLPILQVAALVVFVLTLSPIILGFGNDAAWSVPWIILTNAPGPFFRLIGILVIVAIFLAFIPIIGRLNSLQTLVLGGISLTFVIGILNTINPGSINEHVHFIPGFWFIVGLVVIGGMMSWLGMMVVALILANLELIEEDIGQLVMFPVGAIFGFIPVFMYGYWLGVQVKGGF